MGLRAQRKKMAKKFKVGDLVTWGRGVVNARIVEVSDTGVYVNTVLEDGTPAPRYFVPFVGPKNGTTLAPLRKAEP